MSAVSINLAEKRLLSHLRYGGKVLDQVGKELVVKFANTALRDSTISEIANRNGLSLEDVCVIYGSMIDYLMPNPCINSGGLLLVPTLFFMESHRFDELATTISIETADLSEQERKEKIIVTAVSHGKLVWDAHTELRGEANFKIIDAGGMKSSGCTSVIIIGFRPWLQHFENLYLKRFLCTLHWHFLFNFWNLNIFHDNLFIHQPPTNTMANNHYRLYLVFRKVNPHINSLRPHFRIS